MSKSSIRSPPDSQLESPSKRTTLKTGGEDWKTALETCVKDSITLTYKEKETFLILTNTVKHFNLGWNRLVSSVVSHLLHSFRVYFSGIVLRAAGGWVRDKLLGLDNSLDIDLAVDKGKTTLETCGEDVTLQSKRMRKMHKYTRNEWRRCKKTLETSMILGSGVDLAIKVKEYFTLTNVGNTSRMSQVRFSTRFECCVYIFSTRFECSYTSSPLVSSVVWRRENQPRPE
jgi:hypothetical protein